MKMKSVLKVLLVAFISANLISCSKEEESFPNLNTDTDKEAPILPDRFKITVDDSGKAFLYWEYGSDNVGVTSYEIKQNDKVIKVLEVSKNYFTVEKLEPMIDYTFAIIAIDKAGNKSVERKRSTKFIPSDPNIDKEVPVISKFVISNQVNDNVTLSWDSSDTDIASFQIKLNGNIIATILKNISYYKVKISPNIDHNFSVVAIDRAGNVSQEKKVTANYFPPKNNIVSTINGEIFIPSNKLGSFAKIVTDTNTGKENVSVSFDLIKRGNIISSLSAFKMIISKEMLSKGSRYDLINKSPELVITFSHESKFYTKFTPSSTLEILNFSDEKIEGVLVGSMQDELSNNKIDINIKFSLSF